MAERHGVEHLAFFTVTFPDPQPTPKEASRRMNSLNARVMNERYPEWVAIYERGGVAKKPHFHLLCVTKEDIRTGCNFDEIESGDYRSANAALRAEWAFWRQTTNYNGKRAHLAPYADIGRTELLPVKSTVDGIRKYVGKYVEKHMGHRLPEDKGVRLLRMSRATSQMTVTFTWNSPRSTLWRLKLEAFCREQGYLTTDRLRIDHGPKWAWRLRGCIMSTPLPSHEMTRARTYPTQNGTNRTALALVDHVCADPADIQEALSNLKGSVSYNVRRPLPDPDAGIYDNGPNAAW
jgi:hypothetical protein